METGLIEGHIGRRMKDLGYEEYYTVFRHLILASAEVRIEKAFNELYFLLEDNGLVRIESEFGIYDQQAIINEVSYEHHGEIIITNLDEKNSISVKFIQAIPKHKDSD